MAVGPYGGYTTGAVDLSRTVPIPNDMDPVGQEIPPPQDLATKEAALNAFTLLAQHIGERSVLELLAFGYFTVEGKYGKYRIHRSAIVTLERSDTIGKKTRPIRWKLCVAPQDPLPEGDQILSLVLSIQGDEDAFIETANFRFVETDDEYNGAMPVGATCAAPGLVAGGSPMADVRHPGENWSGAVRNHER